MQGARLKYILSFLQVKSITNLLSLDLSILSRFQFYYKKMGVIYNILYTIGFTSIIKVLQ